MKLDTAIFILAILVLALIFPTAAKNRMIAKEERRAIIQAKLEQIQKAKTETICYNLAIDKSTNI